MAKPWPNGPVVTSTPSVCLYSGCPGVFEPHCLNCLSSSSSKLPETCNKLYNKAEPWPADRINLSLLKKSLDWGLKLRWRVHKVYAIGAAPIGNPGCPEFAFSIASMLKARIVSIANWSFSLNIVVSSLLQLISIFNYNLFYFKMIKKNQIN